MSQPTRITPTQNYVLVATTTPAMFSPSGIILPYPKERRPDRGVVVAVGPGRVVDGVRIPVDLTIGEVVVFVRTSGTDLESNGQWYRFLRDSDILMAFSPQAKAVPHETAS